MSTQDFSSRRSWRLGDPNLSAALLQRLAGYPKLMELQRLAAQGFAVPPGRFGFGDWSIVVGPGLKREPEFAGSLDEELVAFLEQNWVEGAVIVRSVLPGEDDGNQSASGLALSVADVTDHSALAHALHQSHQNLQSPALSHYFAAQSPTKDQLAWLIQQQVPAQAWIMAQRGPPDSPWYMECYRGQADPYAKGETPEYAGDLQNWEARLAPRFRRFVADLGAAYATAPGVEFEIVMDRQERFHCVQARVLAQDPRAAYQAFMRAAQTDLQRIDLISATRWSWDAQHNPEPLSAAHRWLIQALAPPSRETPPHLGVLAGYLFQRESAKLATQPNPTRSQSPTASGAMQKAGEVHRSSSATTKAELRDCAEHKTPLHEANRRLETLLQEHLPRAREQCTYFEQSLATLSLIDLPHALQNALELCQQQLDTLAKWRKPWKDWDSNPPEAKHAPPPFASPETHSAALVDKARFVDVLPTRWDLAAPTLADHPLFQLANNRDSAPLQLPQDVRQARRWAQELDDHSFALALAPLRSLWLWAAKDLGISATDIFHLSGTDLIQASQTKSARAKLGHKIQAEQKQQQVWAQLRVPQLLVSGKPMPSLTQGLDRGLGIGSPYSGPLCHRRDLQHLLEDPPQPEAVLAIPALTAQAAVVLHKLKLRAVLSEHGGYASHGSHMARELGLSAIVGCRGLHRIPDQTWVLLDTKRGRLVWKDPADKITTIRGLR